MNPRLGSMLIEASDIDALARGCAVLGTGGGGDVSTEALVARQAIEEHGPVRVVTLADLHDDDIVMPVGGIGAPSVSAEKIGSGDEVEFLRTIVESVLDRPVGALMAGEIGGGNGLYPIAAAARMNLPLVDGDAIGRAFPEVHMVSMHVAGLLPEFIVVADERRNSVVIRPIDGEWGELLARAVTEVFGGSAAMADYVMPVSRARGAIIEGTVSQALRIGRSVQSVTDPVAALVEAVDAVKLIEGKVADVERRTAGGFVRGSVVVEGYGPDAGRLVRVEIQNENLVVLEDGAVLASVPDLITLVDSLSAEAVATEVVRYGQRVAILAFPCAPIWRTPRGIEIAGPRAFGYDFDYTPLGVSHVVGA